MTTVQRINCFMGEYRFLSIFWLINLEISGKQYKSVKHYYQSMKCLLQEEDKDYEKIILLAISKFGNTEQSMLRTYHCNRAKLLQDPIFSYLRELIQK